MPVAASLRPVTGYGMPLGTVLRSRMCSALGGRSVFETGSLVEVFGSWFTVLRTSGYGRRSTRLRTTLARPVGEGSPVKRRAPQCFVSGATDIFFGDCMRRAWYRSGWQAASFVVWAGEDKEIGVGKSLMRLSLCVLSIRSSQGKPV